MRRSVAIVIGSAALVVAAASGVAAAAVPGGGEQGRTAPVTASALPVSGTRIDAQPARDIATTAVPGGTVVQTEADDLHDRPVWKVTLSTSEGRIVVTVDAVTGQVLTGQPARPGGVTPVPNPRASDDNPGHDRFDDHGGQRNGGDGGPGDDGDRGPGGGGPDDHGDGNQGAGNQGDGGNHGDGGDHGRGGGTDDGPGHH